LSWRPKLFGELAVGYHQARGSTRGRVLDFDLTEQSAKFATSAYAAIHKHKEFVPGVSAIPVTGKVFGESEIAAAIQASSDFWLTAGHILKNLKVDLQRLSECGTPLWLILVLLRIY